MAFKNVHHFWKMLEAITRGVAHFSMTYLGSELNNIVFAFGHINAIKYFKCSNNHKLKCLLLDIFQTVGLSKFHDFWDSISIFNKALKTTE